MSPRTSSVRGARSEFGCRCDAGGSRPPDPRTRNSRTSDATCGAVGLSSRRGQTRVVASWVVAGALAIGAAGCSAHAKSPQGPPSNNTQRFFYSAGAFAVGGTISDIQGKQPDAPLLTQAATLLAPSGGRGIGRIEKRFQYGPVDTPEARWVLTIGSAHTEVTGRQENRDCYVATVTNTMTDLNVLGRIEAERLVMEAESRHCLSGAERDTRFHVTKATFDGLRIDGVLLKPELAKSFGAGQTFAELAARHEAARGRAERERAAKPESARRWELFGGPSSDRRHILTSIFAPVGEAQLEQLQKANKRPSAGPYRLLPDNGIHVPDLGNVYFGWCLVNRDKRETVLLHLELGSPVRGGFDIGGEFGNGHIDP